MASDWIPKGVLTRNYGFAVGTAIILLITAFYHHVLPASAMAVGFTYLLVILGATVMWRLSVCVVMCVVATMTLDYYFLPPVGSFNVDDPQDWVALLAFLVTALIGSTLSAHARERAVEADRRRLETERLYQLSRRLFHAVNYSELYSVIPQSILDCLGAQAVALFISDCNEVFCAGTGAACADERRLRAASSSEPEFEAESKRCRVALRSGERVTGSLEISGAILSREAVEAIATLVAASLDRADAIEQISEMEAARKGTQLRSVVMDAITHDLRTPLTSIKAAVTALLARLDFSREQHEELLQIVDQECDRIDELVGKARETTYLEPESMKLAARSHSVGDLISTALSSAEAAVRERQIKVEVGDMESRVLVDLQLASTALGHLLQNANLYSPPGQPITLQAQKRDRFLLLSVVDEGPGIEEREMALIFEKGYRGKRQAARAEGTGMGLPIARAIVEAHGGEITVASRQGHGSVFTISIPLA